MVARGCGERKDQNEKPLTVDMGILEGDEMF